MEDNTTVQRKSGSRLGLWLILLLLLIGLLWLFFWRGDSEPVVAVPGSQPAAQVDTPAATASAPPVDAAAVTAAPAQTGGTPITDPGLYASSPDKLALVGKEANFSSVQVARIVGPKTFTITSGSDELFVMIDSGLNRAVGSQGQIDKGQTITVQGNFQRLQQEEISDLANNRFRELTEAEREALKKTQVYLHATQFDKVN